MPEESPADPGERQDLERHRREHEQHRGAVLGDEERQCVQDRGQPGEESVAAVARQLDLIS